MKSILTISNNDKPHYFFHSFLAIAPANLARPFPNALSISNKTLLAFSPVLVSYLDLHNLIILWFVY